MEKTAIDTAQQGWMGATLGAASVLLLWFIWSVILTPNSSGILHFFKNIYS
jgi:hypothetical protein